MLNNRDFHNGEDVWLVYIVTHIILIGQL